MTEIELKRWMAKNELTIMDGDIRNRIYACCRGVSHAIPPKTISERTTHTAIQNWIAERAVKVSEEHLVEFLKRIIDMAIEASGPKCRVPGAVFVSNLKKELGYPQ